MLTVFAFLVLVLLAVLAVYVLIKLAFWPLNTARARSHPQAEAINVLSWTGLLLTGGIGWIVALTWAYTRPSGSGMRPVGSGSADDPGLLERIRALEVELQSLKSAGA
jgi:hypothetical protein